MLPKISDVKYFVDIFPYARRVEVKAIMKLTNASETPIDSLHYTIDETWDSKIDIPNAELVFGDEKTGICYL